MGFNVEAACNATKTMCKSSSTGYCAKYVRTFLEAGGLDTSKRPGSACQYRWYLPSIGFNMVCVLSGKKNQQQWTTSSAQPGDIAVMDHGKHGHIAMWNGQQWCSDFYQQNMWPYGGDGTCYIFRYGGQMSGGFGATSLGGSITYKLKECPSHIKFKKLYELYRRRSKSNVQTPSFNGGSTSVAVDTNNLGVSMAMIAKICRWECGKDFNAPMTRQMLEGVYVKGETWKTYGFGSVYFDSQRKCQDIKPVWTETELRNLFCKTVSKTASHVKKWAMNKRINLNQNQIDALVSACYNFGNGFLNKSICTNFIARNPNDPSIPELWGHLSDAQAAKGLTGLKKRRLEEAAWYKGGKI